jgi:hypothetical protein
VVDMTWGFTAQRRADEFDAAVEGTSGRGLHDARDADLLELVGAMRSVPQVTARPEFVAELRDRLMAEAATVLIPDDLSKLELPARRPSRERRLAALVGGLAIVGATTSIAVASQSALPGDSLYPVKRAIEQAHTGLSVGEDSKGETVLANASDRLDEVDALAREDTPTDDVLIADTLNTFTEQATEASDLLLADYAHTGRSSSISQLRDFASSSLDRLAALEPLVPADAHDELIRAAGVLSTIDTEAALRCPDCGGTPIDSIPPALAVAPIVLPQPPAVQPLQPAGHEGRKHPGAADQGGGQALGGTDLPDVDPGDVDPGSVLDPGGGPLLPGGGTDGSNPLQDLANGLTGGGQSGAPTDAPSAPVVGGVVDGVGNILEGVVNPLTGRTTEP